VLRGFLKSDDRGPEALLRDRSDLRQALGLSKVSERLKADMRGKGRLTP
jgi:hypothetical protein